MTTMIDTINGITSGSHQRAGEFMKRAKRDDDGSRSDVHVHVISSGKQSIMQFYLIFYSIFFFARFRPGYMSFLAFFELFLREKQHDETTVVDIHTCVIRKYPNKIFLFARNYRYFD